MNLFGKKKEESKATNCACGGNCTASEILCSIKVLGAGCKSCHDQYEYAKEAVKNRGISVDVEYITDMKQIMPYGVMSMPAIVVNEKVVSVGKVLKVPDVDRLLSRLGF